MPTTTLTCGVGGAGAGRQFSTLQSMFEHLDDGAYVSSGDDVVCELYDDGAFDEDVTLDTGSTIGLASITVRPASGHEPDGAQGTGVRIVRAASSGTILYVSQRSSPLNSNTFIDDFEIDGNGQATSYGFRADTASNASICFRRCMAHDLGNGGAGGIVAGFTKTSSGMDLFNCMAWDVVSDGTSQTAICIDLTTGSSRVGRAINCSAIRATSNSSTGAAINIATNDHISREIHNCVGALQSGTSSGNKIAFGTGSGTSLSVVHSSYNAADDTSAPDVSAPGTAVNSIVAADCFVETTLGMVDLHIVEGCALVDAGVDATTLGLTDIPGLEFDIERTDRTGLDWDIGAHEFVASGGGSGANFDGAATGTVSLQGELATAITLSGQADVLSTVVGELTTQIRFDATAPCEANAQGELATAIPLSGGTTVSAMTAGELITAIQLAGFAVVATSAVGEFDTESTQFDGLASGSVSASGELITGIALAASAECRASAQGALATEITLSGLAAAASGAEGELTTSIALIGQAACQAAVAGALTTEIVIAGAASATANTAGELVGGAGPTFARDTALARVTPPHQLARVTAPHSIVRL